MRKVAVLTLAAALVISGCGTISSEKTESESPAQTESESVETTEEKQQEDSNAEIHFIDPETEEMVTEQIEVDEVNETTIWEQLKEKEIVPKESNVNSLKQEGKALYLDVDDKFGEYFRGQGSTGESYVISSIVNSYLDTFDAEKIQITENGEVLTSSHTMYEGFLTMMEEQK